MSLLSDVPNETRLHLCVELFDFYMLQYVFLIFFREDQNKDQIRISWLFVLTWVDNDTESQVFYLNMSLSTLMLNECHDAFKT